MEYIINVTYWFRKKYWLFTTITIISWYNGI